MYGGENPAVAVLMGALPRALDPEALPDGVRITHQGRAVTLQTIWAGEGFPSDARRALERIHGLDDGAPIVITARRMSVGAIETIAKAGRAWADADGYAEITHPIGIYISRRRPSPLPGKATSSGAWSASADAIAEYVLSRRTENPHPRNAAGFGVDRVAQIAEAVGVSTAQAARVLVSFDEAGYMSKFGAERGPNSVREWRDPSRLLSDWAGHFSRAARKGPRAELHVLMRDPAVWEELAIVRLQGIQWATSGWFAADVLAPFATALPDMTLYVLEADFDSAVRRFTANADVSEVERGGRIRLHAAGRRVFEFVRTVADRPVVSPIRVYADLLRSTGRGAEAAEYLREVAIGF